MRLNWYLLHELGTAGNELTYNLIQRFSVPDLLAAAQAGCINNVKGSRIHLTLTQQGRYFARWGNTDERYYGELSTRDKAVVQYGIAKIADRTDLLPVDFPYGPVESVLNKEGTNL